MTSSYSPNKCSCFIILKLGSSVPPVIIGTTGKKEGANVKVPAVAFEGSPPGTKLTLNESGFMNAELWFSILKDHIGSNVPGGLLPGKKDQVLVICDNPGSHRLSPAQLEQLAVLGIRYFVLPHNTSHVLQACDQEIFSIFKQMWKAKLVEYMRESVGKAPGKYECLALIRPAYDAAFTFSHIQSAFKRVGIVPQNYDEHQKAVQACIALVEGSIVSALGKRKDREEAAHINGIPVDEVVDCNPVCTNAACIMKKSVSDQIQIAQHKANMLKTAGKRMKLGKQLVGKVNGLLNADECVAATAEADKAKLELETKILALQLAELEKARTTAQKAEADHAELAEQCKMYKAYPKEELAYVGITKAELKALGEDKKRAKAAMQAAKKVHSTVQKEMAKGKKKEKGAKGGPGAQEEADLIIIGNEGAPAMLSVGHMSTNVAWVEKMEAVFPMDAPTPVDPQHHAQMVLCLEERLKRHLLCYQGIANSYVWKFVQDNLSAVTYLLLRNQMLTTRGRDDGRQRGMNECLLDQAGFGNEISEANTPLELQGTYVFKDKPTGAFIRSGKVNGDGRGVVERCKEHSAMAKSLWNRKENRLYDAYALEKWDSDLEKYAAVTWKNEHSDEVGKLFHWSSRTVSKLKESKAIAGLGQKKGWGVYKQHMVGYLFECVLDLALDSDKRISDCPGFECFSGYHCAKGKEDESR